jgi:hypothetical protein
MLSLKNKYPIITITTFHIIAYATVNFDISNHSLNHVIIKAPFKIKTKPAKNIKVTFFKSKLLKLPKKFHFHKKK